MPTDLIAILLAAVATLAGVLLFQIARQVVEAPDAGGDVPDAGVPDAGEDVPDGKTISGLGVPVAIMAVVNVAMALFVSRFYGLGPADLARTLLMCAILWACAWADARAMIIPNRVLGVGSALALLILVAELLAAPGQALYLLARTAGAAAALLAASGICRILSPKAVGMGDIKLLAVMGLCLGMDLVWSALFCSFCVLFCVCVFLLVTRRAKRTDSIPFAPFLLAGTILAAFLTGI